MKSFQIKTCRNRLFILYLFPKGTMINNRLLVKVSDPLAVANRIKGLSPYLYELIKSSDDGAFEWVFDPSSFKGNP